MSEESEEVKPLGRLAKHAAAVVAAAKVIAKILMVLVPAVGLALTAYHAAVNEARARAQSAKQLAEDGMQAVRHADNIDKRRLLLLETAVAAMQAEREASRVSPRARRRQSTIPSIVPRTDVKPLPRNLDEAKAQVSAPPAPPPAAPTASPDGRFP